jgi:hypothetical protein
MLSRRSRTLRLKSSSVHWSCVLPSEPPAAAERPSLSSLCMSPFLPLGCQWILLGKEGTPWEGKVLLRSWWLYSCCAIHRSVPRARLLRNRTSVLRSSRKLGYQLARSFGKGPKRRTATQDSSRIHQVLVLIRVRTRIRALREGQTRRQAGAAKPKGLLAGREPGCRTAAAGQQCSALKNQHKGGGVKRLVWSLREGWG